MSSLKCFVVLCRCFPPREAQLSETGMLPTYVSVIGHRFVCDLLLSQQTDTEKLQVSPKHFQELSAAEQHQIGWKDSLEEFITLHFRYVHNLPTVSPPYLQTDQDLWYFPASVEHPPPPLHPPPPPSFPDACFTLLPQGFPHWASSQPTLLLMAENLL